MFVSVFVWKNSVNAVIGGVGMFLSSHAVKSLNNIEKIQPRIMCTLINGNFCTTIISNANDETDIIIFCHDLSSLVQHIPKHNVLIIGGDMNVQIGNNVILLKQFFKRK